MLVLPTLFFLSCLLYLLLPCASSGFQLPPPASLADVTLSTSSSVQTTTATSVQSTLASLLPVSSHLPFNFPIVQTSTATSVQSSLANLLPTSSHLSLNFPTEWLAGGGLTADLSLSISTRPVPARMVQQIRLGRFIEMRDLLWDNAELRRHYEEMHGAMGFHVLPVSSRPRVREVTTLPSWICCFLTFLAASTSDQVIRDRITYAILVVREAMRHGGSGWIDYDRLFRQQASINPSLRWNVIHPELQATTILGQRPAVPGTFCNLCQECDHTSTHCALAQLQPSTIRSGQPSSTRQPARSSTRVCSSWNDGLCIFPGTCNYRHVCSNCYQSSHTVRDCRLPPRSRAGGGAGRSQPTPGSSSV